MTAANLCDPRALLGEFESDLWFPRYRIAESGTWSLRVLPMSRTRGYWGDLYNVHGCPMLFGPSKDGEPEPWMSLSPIEIEAQETGIRAAHGHTAVLGLGMGWVAANVALRPKVTQVTIIERDADVVAFVTSQAVFEQLPREARSKIDIVEADALQWQPNGAVDVVHADIWQPLIEPRKLDDVRRMHANIGARQIYFWGQETEIWRAACRRSANHHELDSALLADIVADQLRLPLILSERPDYAGRIRAGARWWGGHNDDWWADANIPEPGFEP
ncbi:MAG TPA: hypothetical protein VGM17_13655 [Rhizomicrobium sp.]|jgi:hypothetical protein